MSTINLKTRRCSRCPKMWVSVYDDALCPGCSCRDLYETCTPEIIAKIDRLIYESQTIAGLLAIKEALMISLDKSIEWLWWRHDELRRLTPEKFIGPAEGHWEHKPEKEPCNCSPAESTHDRNRFRKPVNH